MHLEMFTNDNYVCCLPFIYVWLLSFFAEFKKAYFSSRHSQLSFSLIKIKGLLETRVLQLMRIVCDPVICLLHAGATEV